MSSILEALKKSEDKRRLGAAPDLATPFSAPRRRSWVWPIAVLLVVAGVVAWALRPATPPPKAAAQTTAPTKTATIANATPTLGQKTGAPLHSVTGNNDVTQTAPPPNLPKPEPQSAAPVGKFAFGQPMAGAPAAELPADRRAARERRHAEGGGVLNNNRQPLPPVVAGTKAPAVAAKAPPSAAKPPAVVPPPKPIASATSVAANTAPATGAAAAPAKAAAPAAESTPTRAAKSAATVGLTPPPATPAAKPAAPVASSAQPYAELPFSVRKSLPELKLSMHVYAADPAHRFVVLNDSRLTEGEKTTDEIFVREIRPDGVVLEFQNQRFFYPRDGL